MADIVPSRLLKYVFDTAIDDMQHTHSHSLQSGVVPADFKFKKENLDPTVLSNLRPTTKFPFLPKILEKIVLQLQNFLDQNGTKAISVRS